MIDPEVQTDALLVVLATAETAQERQSALELVLLALDHIDADSSIPLIVRCFQKEFLQQRGPYNETIMASYLRLLRVLFQQCSDEAAIKTFHHIGADLVSLLVSFLQGRPSSVAESSLYSLIDWLAQLNVSLPAVQQKETLMRCMCGLVRDENRAMQSVALQLMCGWAQHAASVPYILNLPGFVEDVAQAASKNATEGQPMDKVSLHTATLFSRLAWDVCSKHKLVHKKGFLGAVLWLLKNDQSGDIKTLRATIATLCQLTTEATGRFAICKCDKGVILKMLLAYSDHPELCRLVHHSILRLIGRESTQWLLKKHPDLIERLTLAAQNANGAYKEASDLAAQSLKRLASFVAVRDKAHPDLLDALTDLAKSSNSQTRFWAANGMHEQTKSKTGRFYIARTGNVLKTLIQIAKTDPCLSVKSVATEALLLLALDDANSKRRSEILEAFVEQADECQASGRAAVTAILSLANHKTANKTRIAKTLGLVESLSKYAMSHDSDGDIKRAALKCIIILAPLM